MNLPIDIKCNLTKPVTILIQKIANAIGVLYEPNRIIKKANAEAEVKLIKTRTDAEVKLIKEVNKFELTAIQERGLMGHIYQQERKQKNIEQVISLALPQIPEYALTENIDEDWLAYFFAHSELVSDKDMQSLWANILAGEATKPSSFSKRTIDFVATISREDAELFTNLSQFVFILNEQLTLLIFESKESSKEGELDELYIKQKISTSTLYYLESIGVVKIYISPMTIIREWGISLLNLEIYNNTAIYFDKPILNIKETNKLPIGYVFFTKIGEELATICGAQANDEFYDYVVNLWKEQDLIIYD